MYPSFAKRFVERQKFTEEDQQIYNNHIIENFIEKVNEMNGVVLIPSKLKDLENPQNPLNEDLYQCFRMINTVKRDLFEPSLQENSNSGCFTPKRKISKALIQRKEEKEAAVPLKERKISSVTNIPYFERKSSQGSPESSPSRVSSCSDLTSMDGQQTDIVINGVVNDVTCKNSVQLTDMFIHHLHCMYNILEHFAKAADYITEQYLELVEP